MVINNMNESDALQWFRDSGALLEGHFILRSGRHSRQFFQCALALQNMSQVVRLGEALVEQVRKYKPQTVVAPAMGGLVIGQEVARQLGCRFIFPEKEEGRLVLRRGFTIDPNERCLVVEDVVTQGGRVRETIDIIQQSEGIVVGVAMLVNRSEGDLNLGAPTCHLIRAPVETFAPDNLPAELQSIPAVKPGSK
jgi:orotate phosphoribosyltransferase